MKKTTYLKTLLVALCLYAGVNQAWADDVVVPTPVYFNDFSSTTNLTQVGSGEFVTDTDARFGAIYHNNPSKNKTARTNYLKLPADVLTHSGATNKMTIGFWINMKDASGENFFHCPVFSAYKTSTPGIDNGSPMFRASAKGVMQLNNGDGKWTDFTKEENDDEGKKTSGNTESTVYLDDANWHYYTITLTSTKGIIYVDGSVVNSWTINNDITPAFFATAASNGYPVVCLGGNQSWNWNDWDASFGYDDIAIYDQALSAEQINKIISNKLHYTVNAVDGSSKILKVLADANSSTNSVSYAYPRYINVDGTLYTKAAGTGTNHYQGSLTLTSGNQIESVPYTASSYLSVLYFKEAEDVLSSTTSGGASSRCSNMAGGYASSATKITTLPAGTYTIYFGAYASSSTHLYFYKNSESGGIIKDYTGSGSWQEANTGKFTLDKATDILVKGGSSAGYVFDYFIITGDIVGATDCSTDYLGEMTDKVTLYPGQSWHYKFINHNGLSSDNYKNYVVPVYNTSDERKITVRADNWEDMHHIGDTWGSNAGCTSNFNWTNWISNMNGATVDMTVTFTSERVFNMSAKITAADKSEWTYSYANNYTDSPIDLTSSDYIKVALSVSSSWLEVVESWPTTVSKTISDAGWATYCSPYALDFTSSIANLTKAYLVTGNTGASLTLSPITGTIPANTGILLEGEGDVTIPVVASSTTNVSANKLEGVTTATEKKAESIYVLMASPKVGFYKNTNAFTVGANTAYLPKGFGTGYARSFFSFDDEETTSVNELKTTNFTNNTNEVFDLQGRRVAQPTKGLYIVNGKKVVIK